MVLVVNAHYNVKLLVTKVWRESQSWNTVYRPLYIYLRNMQNYRYYGGP